MRRVQGVLVLVAVVLIMLSLSLFVVDQRQKAIVFQLGEIISVKDAPGLYWKIPLIQNVRFYDAMIQTMDARDPERFITSEKINVLVDSFVKWRIVDVVKYHISVAGIKSRAEQRLSQTVNSVLRAEFGKRTVHDVVSGEREKIMEFMRERADADARSIGLQVLDVRIKRVELPDEVRDSVYRRMEAERKRVANERRSTGAGDAEKIRADADRQREVLLAEAYREAQRVRGEGDAKAAAIYAEAYNQDPQFYSFYRSLDAYRGSFRSKADVLLLDPSSDFLKYLKGPGSFK